MTVWYVNYISIKLLKRKNKEHTSYRGLALDVNLEGRGRSTPTSVGPRSGVTHRVQEAVERLEKDLHL